MRDAALALQIPFVSGKDSMKNDFRGKLDGKPVTISVPPTLLITAVGKVSDAKLARTSDFKAVGDLIYLLGGNRLGLWGSELLAAAPDKVAGAIRLAEPDWDEARRVYQWLGGGTGREQARLRSAHDVSDGGLLVCVAESLLARGLGAQIQAPASRDAWEFAFGEGFHALVVSIPEADQATVETEWQNAGVPFTAIGKVTNRDRLDFALAPSQSPGARPRSFSVDVKSLRAAWLKEGYWE